MKPSRRNRENEANERARLAAGKPAVSRFERKRLTAEEIHERERAVANASKKGGVVSR